MGHEKEKEKGGCQISNTMTARKSPRRTENALPEKTVVEPQNESDDDAPEEEQPPRSTKRRSATREERKKRKDTLRAKSLGVVGKIDTEQIVAKKIVFGDKYLPDEPKQRGDVDDDVDQDEGDDDDDDEVEEVKASVAKGRALEQMQQERKTASNLLKLESKRKRKVVEEKMDEEFFAQVDAELDQERKAKKRSKVAKPKGKLTTFVSTDETDNATHAEHNIDVVVLGSEVAVAAALGTKPSEAARVFSRTRQADGKGTVRKSGPLKKTSQAKAEGWTRSKKMNRILLGRQQHNRKQQKGKKPAVQFVIEA